MTTLKFKFLNRAGLTLNTHNPELAEFIKHSLWFFRDEPKAPKTITVSIVKSISAEETEAIAEHINLSRQGLYYRDEKADYAVHLGKDILEIEAALRKRAIIKQWGFDSIYCKRPASPRKVRNGIYLGLMRSAVHFPLFWLLERDGIFLTHASSVEKEGNGIILLGLNGVGKTTLMQHLVKRGFKYVTDNYLLFDGNRIYPFPEAVGLVKGNDLDLGQVIYETTAKRFIKINESFVSSASDGIRPGVAFLVTRAVVRSRNKLSELDRSSLPSLAMTINDVLREFHHYSPISLLNLFDSNNNIYSEKLSAFRRLSDSIRLYKIVNDDLDDTVTKIIEVFERDI